MRVLVLLAAFGVTAWAQSAEEIVRNTADTYRPVIVGGKHRSLIKVAGPGADIAVDKGKYRYPGPVAGIHRIQPWVVPVWTNSWPSGGSHAVGEEEHRLSSADRSQGRRHTPDPVQDGQVSGRNAIHRIADCNLHTPERRLDSRRVGS